MLPWRWSETRTPGAQALAWLRPFSAAVPWITVGLLLQMLALVGGTLTRAEGVLFDLPPDGPADGADGVRTKLVVLVMPMPNETLVFFDDARYALGDPSSVSAFAAELAERAGKLGEKTLLVLADRRVAGGDLMKLAGVVRGAGLERVLVAEKRETEGAE
jgi:biopolymer transport protein ExbD